MIPIFKHCFEFVTLPETNIAPENGWLTHYFPFRKARVQVLTVSFSEGNLHLLMQSLPFQSSIPPCTPDLPKSASTGSKGQTFASKLPTFSPQNKQNGASEEILVLDHLQSNLLVFTCAGAWIRYCFFGGSKWHACEAHDGMPATQRNESETSSQPCWNGRVPFIKVIEFHIYFWLWFWYTWFGVHVVTSKQWPNRWVFAVYSGWNEIPPRYVVIIS